MERESRAVRGIRVPARERAGRNVRMGRGGRILKEGFSGLLWRDEVLLFGRRMGCAGVQVFGVMGGMYHFYEHVSAACSAARLPPRKLLWIPGLTRFEMSGDRELGSTNWCSG